MSNIPVTQSIVFTAIPAPRTQATSESFKQYGVTNEVASPMREVALFPVSRPKTLQASLIGAYICALVQASLLRAAMSVANGLSYKSLLSISIPFKDFFTIPEIVVSFKTDNLKDPVTAAMAALGFRKESAGRRAYYRGAASVEAIQRCAKLGCEMDTYAPYGATNIHGYSAFRNAQKLILTAIASITQPFTGETSFLNVVPLTIDAIKLSTSTFVIKHLKNIPDDSIAFPYFDGLCLPDKTTVPAIISRYFYHTFGNDEKSASSAFKIFCSGWNSLSTTNAGVALTHMAAILELAITTGAKPYVLMISRNYAGMILTMPGLAVMKNGIRYSAGEASAVIEKLRALDSHADAVRSVLAIINGKLFSEETDYIRYSRSSTTPRFLHNLLRTVTLNDEDMKTVRQSAMKFKFTDMKYWDPLNSTDILAAAKAIINAEDLDDDAPLAFRTEAFVTKDLIFSTLAAFGPMAPSLIGKGTTYSIVINGKETMKPTMPTGLKLEGFPIFVKPLQEAYEDWKMLRSNPTITMKLRHHDKKPPTIMGLSKVIPFADGGNTLNSIIGAWSDKRKVEAENKRKREDEPEDDIKQRAKKSRSDETNKDALAAMGIFVDQEDDDEPMGESI